MEPAGSVRVPGSLSLVPVLSQMNPISILYLLALFSRQIPVLLMLRCFFVLDNTNQNQENCSARESWHAQ
jgi:hypothetical protein